FCNTCVPGTFQSLPGQFTCLGCLPGTEQPNDGQSYCKPCDQGSHQAISGQPQCSLCPIGTYSNKDGASVCTVCPKDETTDDFGATSCKKIDAQKAFAEKKDGLDSKKPQGCTTVFSPLILLSGLALLRLRGCFKIREQSER
ncbi:MAG TPA: hypothetical protein VEK06_02935, partial [Myxococcota bacterium]|nr:hypothetical protein [Myxococcota bacterium]